MFYKYLGLKVDGTVRADFLTNGLFRFTQPNQLNDPFEVRPRVLMEAYAEEDIELAQEAALNAGFPRDQIEKFLPLFLETTPRRMTPEEFPGLVFPQRPGSVERFRSVEEMDACDADQALEDLLKHVNEIYGFFCLTTSRDNPPMWSHYADSHQGIVVGFNAHHSFFSGSHDFIRLNT